MILQEWIYIRLWSRRMEYTTPKVSLMLNKTWTLGDDVFYVVSLIVMKASLWSGTLTLGQIVHA